MPKINPKVTVLMSVYNGEKYLRQALDSILNQTFRDFEFLIINDGSTDKTAEILRGYSNPRIKVIKNKKNIGLTRSLNRGLEMARGKYIARMDADDISLPTRLEKEVELLDQRESVGLVGTYCLMIDSRGKVFSKFKQPSNDKKLRNDLLRENQFAHGSVMFKKKCLERIGLYREGFKFVQDYDLWLRMADFFDLAIIPEFLYQWRLDFKSISARKKAQQDKFVSLAIKLAKERKQFSKESLRTLNLLSKTKPRKKIETVYGYNYWAKILLDGNSPSEAMRLILKSLFTYPKSKASWRLFFEALSKL